MTLSTTRALWVTMDDEASSNSLTAFVRESGPMWQVGKWLYLAGSSAAVTEAAMEKAPTVILRVCVSWFCVFLLCPLAGTNTHRLPGPLSGDQTSFSSKASTSAFLHEA